MVSLFFSAVPSKISRDSNSQVPIGLISAPGSHYHVRYGGSNMLQISLLQMIYHIGDVEDLTPMAVDIYRSFLKFLLLF